MIQVNLTRAVLRQSNDQTGPLKQVGGECRSLQGNRKMPKSTFNPIVPSQDVPGAAALAICESLLLALNDLKILPEFEIVGVLRDAAAAHDNHPDLRDGQAEMHKSVSVLINRIIDGGNSVRRR